MVNTSEQATPDSVTQNMRVRVLMITHNRAGYTALSLARLCETMPDFGSITVWDNGSNADTVAVLERFKDHPRVERIVYNPTNDKLHGPTNWFWSHAGDAEFLSKVDDDGLMPHHWVETLIHAHRDIPEAGVLGTWRFMDEDFDGALASKKIHQFGEHQLLRNCWVEGSGYLMRRAVLETNGLLRDGESFTTWCIRAAAAGYINGWYYPFLWQEHMDDPRAPHSGMQTEEDFLRLAPLTAKTFGVKNRSDWIELNKRFARKMQMCSFDPNDFLSLRARLCQKVWRLFGGSYVPRA